MDHMNRINSNLVFRSLLVVLFVSSAPGLSAQQSVLFNTYLYDPMQLNIAYAGHECTEANLNYRNQWIGLKDAPKLYQLNAHTSFANNTGLALRLASQQAGLLNGLQVTAGYGYQVKIDQVSKVLFGIGVGFIQNTLNAQKTTVIDANDVTLSDAGKQRAIGFDSEIGVQFLGDKIKGGLSVLHLYNTNPNFAGSTYKTLPQINATFSYLFNKGKQIELEPMLVDRLTLKGTNTIEGLVNAHFNKLVTAGVGYRVNYGVLVFAGIKINKIKLAYSFDYGTSKNKTLTGSSHQVLLGYYFCKERSATLKKTRGKKIMKSRF